MIETKKQSKDVDTILNNRDVDKNEIKSALEKKLDKFDGFDGKFEDYAKKLKEETPKIEKDANVARNRTGHSKPGRSSIESGTQAKIGIGRKTSIRGKI